MSSPIDANTPEPQEQNPSQEVKKEIVEFAKMIVWFLAVFFLVKTYIIEGYEVQGPSMQPTLADRERILVFKLPHVLSRHWPFTGINALDPADIVVFDSPVEANKRYVKRLIAKGAPLGSGKTVSAKQDIAGEPNNRDGVRVLFDRGAVYVNNKRIEEKYLPPEARSADERCEEKYLQPGTYYVMGDNRGVSKDSRSFGPIDDACVIGRAVLCFWPPSHVRLLK